MVMVSKMSVMGNNVLSAKRAAAESPPFMMEKDPNKEGIRNSKTIGGTYLYSACQKPRLNCEVYQTAEVIARRIMVVDNSEPIEKIEMKRYIFLPDQTPENDILLTDSNKIKS